MTAHPAVRAPSAAAANASRGGDGVAAERRRQVAERHAEVRLHADDDQTASLVADKMPQVQTAAGYARIVALARARKAAGLPGSLGEHKAAVLLGLITPRTRRPRWSVWIRRGDGCQPWPPCSELSRSRPVPRPPLPAHNVSSVGPSQRKDNCDYRNQEGVWLHW